MKLALTHYSKAEVRSVYSCSQARRVGPKPAGLWLSVDEGDQGWAHWCRSEGFAVDRLAVIHDVALAADARILLITSPVDLDIFTEAFAAPVSERWHYRGDRIDWQRVAEAYQGIIIAPYLWSRRLHDGSFWYYGWDCASGCIWDAKAIASVSPRAAEPPVEEAA